MPLTGFITCKSADEAHKIASELLKKRLVTCANIVKEISSSYWWHGKIENAEESLVIIKTRTGLESKIIKETKKHHSYALPAIEFIKTETDRETKNWILKETTQ